MRTREDVADFVAACRAKYAKERDNSLGADDVRDLCKIIADHEAALAAARQAGQRSQSATYTETDKREAAAFQRGLEAGKAHSEARQTDLLEMITDAFTGRTPVMGPVPVEVQDIIVRIRSIGEVSYQRGWEARGVHDAKER